MPHGGILPQVAGGILPHRLGLEKKKKKKVILKI